MQTIRKRKTGLRLIRQGVERRIFSLGSQPLQGERRPAQRSGIRTQTREAYALLQIGRCAITEITVKTLRYCRMDGRQQHRSSQRDASAKKDALGRCNQKERRQKFGEIMRDMRP